MKDLKFIKTVTVTTSIEKYNNVEDIFPPIEVVEVKKTVFVNWDLIPVGTKFTATIDGDECEGRIQKEYSFIYLCQNAKNGASTKNKLGYKYSWEIDKNETLGYYNIVNLEIELDPDFIDNYVEPEVFPVGEYEASFFKGFIKIGCQTITNECVRKVVEKLVD